MKAPIRDAEKVLATLKRVGDKVITLEGCKIHIPVRYETVGLATVGVDTVIYGFFNLILADGSYCTVSNVCSMIPVTPDEISTFKIDDVAYYELSFDKGSVLFPNMKVFRNDLIIQKVFNEFINKGKLPYWTTYEDSENMFSTASTHANANLGSFEGLAISTSIIARDPNDVSRYYRETLGDPNATKQKPVYVPAASVRHSATRTVAKLVGSHSGDAIVSAINNPSEQADLIDYVLRY